MSKRTRKGKREAYVASEAAENVARVAGDFYTPNIVLGEIAQAVDTEYRELVETAEMAAEYLEEVPDTQARILVRLLRDALLKVTTPKASDEEGEQPIVPLPDPTPKEREAAVGYLAVCMNPKFGKMVLGLREDKTALARGRDTLALDRFKKMLRGVGFRWTDDYFENQWTNLVEEASRQRQAMDEAERDGSAEKQEGML
jgi:hypothetical protein